MSYRWDSPKDWLFDKIHEHSDDIDFLRSLASDLVDLVDNDEIQDLMQSEMIEDGYFETEEETDEDEDEDSEDEL